MTIFRVTISTTYLHIVLRIAPLPLLSEKQTLKSNTKNKSQAHIYLTYKNRPISILFQ